MRLSKKHALLILLWCTMLLVIEPWFICDIAVWLSIMAIGFRYKKTAVALTILFLFIGYTGSLMLSVPVLRDT